MRNLLALAALAVVTFAGVGWYLGWYRVQTEPAGNGHRQVTIDFNGPQIGHDVKKGEEKLRGILDKNTAQAPAPSAVPTPSPGAPSMPPPPRTVLHNRPQPAPSAPSWSHPEEDYPGSYRTASDIPPPPSVPLPPPLPPQGN